MLAKYWQIVDIYHRQNHGKSSICHRFPARAPNQDTFSNMTDTEKPITNFIVTLFQLFAKEALLPNVEAIYTVKGVQGLNTTEKLGGDFTDPLACLFYLVMPFLHYSEHTKLTTFLILVVFKLLATEERFNGE